MGNHTSHTNRTSAFVDTALWAGCDEQVITAALAATAPRLVVSGRLASGKDTVAEAVMKRIGRTDAIRVSFATALRKEMDQIIDAVRLEGTHAAETVVARVGNITIEQARNTAALIRDALAADPTVHSHVRTREIRLALQEWGTDVRRRSDDSYWVKQAMRHSVELVATGRAVYVTDARFPNEVDATRNLGFLAVRLEVALPVRAARLMARDGLTIDPAAENHPSEKELETYPGFDLWVDNSGELDASVEHVVSVLTPVPA